MQEFYYCSIGNEGIALSAAKTTIYQIERRVRREKTYSAMYFVCRAGMAFLVAGIQMDAVRNIIEIESHCQILVRHQQRK